MKYKKPRLLVVAFWLCYALGVLALLSSLCWYVVAIVFFTLTPARATRADSASLQKHFAVEVFVIGSEVVGKA